MTIRKGFLKKTYPTWNKVYRVSFSIIVNKLPKKVWTNVFHFTNGKGNGNYGVYGNRIPAVWVNNAYGVYKNGFFHISSAVSGKTSYEKNYQFSLGKQYDITIQQLKQNGKYWFEILINGHSKLKVQNTTPRKFSNVKEYISDPWTNPFTSDLGIVSNLEIEQ